MLTAIRYLGLNFTMLYLTVSPNTSRESEENIEYYHCVLWVIETSELGDECAKKQNMYASQVKMTIEPSPQHTFKLWNPEQCLCIYDQVGTTHPSRGYRSELGTISPRDFTAFLEINTALPSPTRIAPPVIH